MKEGAVESGVARMHARRRAILGRWLAFEKPEWETQESGVVREALRGAAPR